MSRINIDQLWSSATAIIFGRKTTGAGQGEELSAAEVRTLINVADGANVGLPLIGGSLSGALNEAKGTDIASATTTDIGAATGNYVVVMGTTTITGLGTVQAGTRRKVNFSGVLILTHNATSLILPTSANITTAAGDNATFISLGSGNWVCTSYQRKDGTALVSAGGATPVHVKLTSTFSTTSASYVDITGMTLNVTAGKTYKLDFTIYENGDEATDYTYLKLVGVTSTLVMRGMIVGMVNLTANVVSGIVVSGAASLADFGRTLFPGHLIGSVIVTVTGSNGSVKLQLQRQSGAGTGVSVFEGTTMTLTEVS